MGWVLSKLSCVMRFETEAARPFSCISNSFSYKMFCTKTRFKTEANQNSQMGYSFMWWRANQLKGLRKSNYGNTNMCLYLVFPWRNLLPKEIAFKRKQTTLLHEISTASNFQVKHFAHSSSSRKLSIAESSYHGLLCNKTPQDESLKYFPITLSYMQMVTARLNDKTSKRSVYLPDPRIY